MQIPGESLIKTDPFSHDAEIIWKVAEDLHTVLTISTGQNTAWLQWTMAGILTKQMRLMRSALLLAEHGLDREMFIILRVFLELYFHECFILSQSKKGAAAMRYWAWSFATVIKQARTIVSNKSSPDLGLWEQILHELESQTQEIRQEIEKQDKKGWDKFISNGPPMLNVADLAKGLTQCAQYDLIYRHTSQYVHSSDSRQYVQIDPTFKSCHTFLDASNIDLEMAIVPTLALLVDSMDAIESHFQYGKMKKIKELHALDVFKDLRQILQAPGAGI